MRGGCVLLWQLLLLLGSAHASMWKHSVNLSPKVRLSWTPNDKTVIFHVDAATRGYVGLGFSATGSMSGADIVIAWVDDATGQAHLADYHGTHNGAPVRDEQQDVELLGAEQNATHTSFSFRRKWSSCDVEHDMQLGGDTVRVIWALHESDPDNGRAVTWHGKDARGVRSVYLQSSPVASKQTRRTAVRHWDVRMSNLLIPDNMDTLYWCKIFKLPALGRKHHMIGYTPLLDSKNMGSVHHMLLHECVSPRAQHVFPRYVAHEGAACYSPSMPVDWENCLTPIVAWAVGSEGEFLPEHVGLPLSETDHDTFFMLEVHYDNPSFRMGRDNSGIRVHFTEELRRHDGAVMTTGISVTPLHLIPPFQAAYATAGYCNSQCTSKMFPEEGIKVVSVVLHSHIAGHKMKLRHIRNGKELEPIAEDNKYDFNYQQSRVLRREKVIHAGDELVTECVYQTKNRTEPTFGGYSTKEEMCLAFVLHYPRTHLAGCYSMTPVKAFFETLGVRQFYSTDMASVERMFLKLGSHEQEDLRQLQRPSMIPPGPGTPFPDFPPEGGHIDDEANQRAIIALKQMKVYTLEPADAAGEGQGVFGDLQIRLPVEFQNKSFAAHLVELPWAESLLTQRIEESFYRGPHMTFCRMRDDQLALPATIHPFPVINSTERPPDPLAELNCPVRKGTSLEHSSFSGADVLRPAWSLLATLLFRRLLL